MLIKKAAEIRESEVTPKELFLKRREFIAAAGVTAAAVATNGLGLFRSDGSAGAQNPKAQKLADVKKSPLSTDEKLNSYRDITTYNNFYEFGLDKADPGRYAHTLKPRPWSVQVTGEAAKQGTFTLEDILAPHPLEERIYRFRCVEAWSMVVPWVGFPLGDLLSRFEPTSRAKYVQFFTLAEPEQMPGLSYRVLEWPYREGLTIGPLAKPTVKLPMFGGSTTSRVA